VFFHSSGVSLMLSVRISQQQRTDFAANAAEYQQRMTLAAEITTAERVLRRRTEQHAHAARVLLGEVPGDEALAAIMASAQEQLTTRGGSSRAAPSGSQNGTPSSWATVARRGHQASASRGAQQKLAAKGRPLTISAAPLAMDAKLCFTIKEKQRRMQNRLCLKCGKAGHRIAECRFGTDA